WRTRHSEIQPHDDRQRYQQRPSDRRRPTGLVLCKTWLKSRYHHRFRNRRANKLSRRLLFTSRWASRVNQKNPKLGVSAVSLQLKPQFSLNSCCLLKGAAALTTALFAPRGFFLDSLTSGPKKPLNSIHKYTIIRSVESIDP